MLFIFCSLKALPNIKLIKKSHKPIIKKTDTPEPPQQQNTVWAYSKNTLFNTRVKQRLMLDYLTEGIAFWMTLFGVQESLLEFRLGYLGRYWFFAISASLLLSFLLFAPITITLIIRFTVDPFTFPGNIILSGIAAIIFGVILTLAQWLILRQSEMTPRVFVGTASVSTLYSPIPTPLALIKDNQKSPSII